MVSISLHEDEIEKPFIVPINVLNVPVPFDRERYLKIRGTSDFSYYMELLELGFKKASEFKELPYDDFFQIQHDFIQSNYRNEWIELKKKFKTDDLEIILKSHFTTNHFQVIATINRISTRKELVSDVIITTEPYEVVFDSLIDNVLIDNDITIINKFGKTIIKINKKDLFNGVLNYQIIGNKEDVDRLKYEKNIV